MYCILTVNHIWQIWWVTGQGSHAQNTKWLPVQHSKQFEHYYFILRIPANPKFNLLIKKSQVILKALCGISNSQNLQNIYIYITFVLRG